MEAGVAEGEGLEPPTVLPATVFGTAWRSCAGPSVSWGSRIRTCIVLSQSQASYRLLHSPSSAPPPPPAARGAPGRIRTGILPILSRTPLPVGPHGRAYPRQDSNLHPPRSERGASYRWATWA